jgi:hypothetical protein
VDMTILAPKMGTLQMGQRDKMAISSKEALTILVKLQYFMEIKSLCLLKHNALQSVES